MANDVSYDIFGKIPSKLVVRGVCALCILFFVLFFLAYTIKIPLNIPCRMTITYDSVDSKKIAVLIDKYYLKYFQTNQALEVMFNARETDDSIKVKAKVKSIRKSDKEASLLILVVSSIAPELKKQDIVDENQFVVFKVSLLKLLITY